MQRTLFSLLRPISFLLIFATIALTISMPPATAQDRIEITERDYQNSSVEMADQFRADGKIYVVVAVILTIFAGMTVFLVLTERKLHRLEQEVKQMTSKQT